MNYFLKKFIWAFREDFLVIFRFLKSRFRCQYKAFQRAFFSKKRLLYMACYGRAWRWPDGPLHGGALGWFCWLRYCARNAHIYITRSAFTTTLLNWNVFLCSFLFFCVYVFVRFYFFVQCFLPFLFLLATIQTHDHTRVNVCSTVFDCVRHVCGLSAKSRGALGGLTAFFFL